jgi:hypothetical protein
LPEFELPPQPQPKFRVFRDVVFRYEVRTPNGEIKVCGEHHLDLVPNAGLNWISSQMAGNVTGAGTVICLGTSTTTPTMGNLTLGGEITGSGLSRTTGSTSGVGALANLAASATTNQTTGSFFVFQTFTASGIATVNEAGVSPSMTYNAGIIARDLLSPAASMAAGDTLRTEFEFIL